MFFESTGMRTLRVTWRSRLLDEAIGAVNRWEPAPIDGESSERPPNVDSFGGIDCNAAEDSRSHTELLTHSVW